MTFQVGKLPPPIRVGPHDIRFCWMDAEESKKTLGMFEHTDHTIRLLKEYNSGSMAVDTAIHEVLHAIFAVATVEVKQGEEHIVSVLGTFLTQIIRDNPEFLKWLQVTVAK